MNIEWRTSGMVAAIAGILTMLIAGIAGHNLGTILIRAVVSALLAGVGATGLQILVARFLPELMQIDSGDASETPSGQSVNLVVGDEEEDIRPPSSLAGIEAVDDDALDDDADGMGDTDSDATGAGEVALDSNTEDSDSGESRLAPLQEAVDGDTVRDGSSVAHEIQEGQRAPMNDDDDDEEEVEELTSGGELPEIGGLESSFRDISLDGESASDRKSGGDQGNTMGQDPAEIAKALQTMMKRE